MKKPALNRQMDFSNNKAAKSVKRVGNVAIVKDWTESHENKDHFIKRDGKTYAGTHLIVDFWGASNLDNLEMMEKAMREAVEVAKATLLHIHLHHFTPNGGISGVAVLAESHISVHSWPERDFAAFDIFMCGDSAPEKAVAVLQSYFKPDHVTMDTMLRGETDED